MKHYMHIINRLQRFAIAEVFSLSLHERSFVSAFAHAIVCPKLKKPSLYPGDLASQEKP